MNVYTLHHICIFNDGGIFVIKIYKKYIKSLYFIYNHMYSLKKVRLCVSIDFETMGM